MHLSDPTSAPLKKMFYALRPAAAIRWLARHPAAAVAPMHFPTLMNESEPPSDVAVIVSDLLARKAVTRELGTGPVPPPILAFIDGELERARMHAVGYGATRSADLQRERRVMCEYFYAEAVRRFDPAA